MYKRVDPATKSTLSGKIAAFLAGHAIPEMEAVDLFADRDDDSGRIRSRHVRERGSHLIAAAAHQIVHVADRRGVDVDENLVGLWMGFRRLANG
jgi:hypothetical protein